MRSYKRLLIGFLFLFAVNIGSSQIVAPDFSVYTTQQDSFHLYEEYLDQGKVVLIEFFFTTCPPCAEIAPFMEGLYQDWGGGNQNVEFILITNKSFDETPDVADYCDQYGFTFPGLGVDGGALGVWNTYKDSPWGSIFGTPAFIIIAPDGDVQYDVSGATVQSTLDSLDAAISRALGNQDPEVKYFDKILSTHYHSGDTILNVFGSFINFPDMGDTSLAPPVNAGKFTDFLPDSVAEDANFTIELNKSDGDLLEGISTFDLFFIQRGILGLDTLDFYQTAAADINDDGRLSGSDIIALRRVILELEDSFPGRTAWRFFPDYTPQNTLDSLQYDHYWEFPEEWHYATEVENDGLLSFKAVKIGDVNHSWQSFQAKERANERHFSSARLVYEFNHVSKAFDFYLNNVDGNVKSFQFDLVLPGSNSFELTSSLPTSNFLYRSINKNTLRVGFFDAFTRGFTNRQPIFSIRCPLDEQLGFQINRSELMDACERPKSIVLEKSGSGEGITIYPNPAEDHISVYSKERALIEIIGSQGQVLLKTEIMQGMNRVDISHLVPGNYILHRSGTKTHQAFLKL